MIIGESRWRDLLRLFVWYPFRWFCQVAPIWINYRLFYLMGLIHFKFSKVKRTELNHILTKALFPLKEGESVHSHIRDYFVNHYIDRMSIFHYHRLNHRNIDKVIKFKGLDLLEDALSRGKGCVLVHGHLGPSQLPLVALGKMGYSMTQLGFRTDENLSNIGKKVQMRTRLRIEERFPAQMLYVDRFLRQVFKNLAQNGVVMVAADGSGTARRFGHHEPFKFMGEKMLFPTGPFKLSQKSGAVLLFLFLTRDGRFRHTGIIRRPEALSDKMQTLSALSAFVRQLERYIRQDPGQWQFWDGFESGLHVP
jgi:lauroyl/myristoyl acyltransferase